MTLFEPIREQALMFWAQGTGRQVADTDGNYLLNDNFNDAYDCDWQTSFTSRPGNSTKHVNIFCSLGSWASNLTDLLQDTRFDQMDLDNEADAEIIFRHYTRIFLIVSEILTDFQDMYLKVIGLPLRGNSQVARKFYYPLTGNHFNEIMNYINKVCKHKTDNIHYCNNHNPIFFADSRQRRPRRHSYMQLADSTHTGKTATLVPKLSILVRSILHCYARINKYFDSHKAQFTALCCQYS